MSTYQINVTGNTLNELTTNLEVILKSMSAHPAQAAAPVAPVTAPPAGVPVGQPQTPQYQQQAPVYGQQPYQPQPRYGQPADPYAGQQQPVYGQPQQGYGQQPPATVPTAAPTYTLDQISQAAAMLMDMGPQQHQALMGLLQQFGVPALTALPKEQYGAFATALRGLGAKI